MIIMIHMIVLLPHFRCVRASEQSKAEQNRAEQSKFEKIINTTYFFWWNFDYYFYGWGKLLLLLLIREKKPPPEDVMGNSVGCLLSFGLFQVAAGTKLAAGRYRCSSSRSRIYQLSVGHNGAWCLAYFTFTFFKEIYSLADCVCICSGI